ncbi:hypothetical protein CB1_000811014 [Camelus ferus]|nr:hypothetical protein CB1_000811014 [Camelus ferus]
MRLRRPRRRQPTAYNRRTENVSLPLARHRHCSFATIVLAGSWKPHLPYPGRLLRESCRDQARAVPGTKNRPRDRSHPCGSVPPIPSPTHRLHRCPPHVLTGSHLLREEQASQPPPPQPPLPPSQLIGTSFCEVGRVGSVEGAERYRRKAALKLWGILESGSFSGQDFILVTGSLSLERGPFRGSLAAELSATGMRGWENTALCRRADGKPRTAC